MVKSPISEEIPDSSKTSNQENFENSTAFKRMKISSGSEIRNNKQKLQLSSPISSEDSNNENLNNNEDGKLINLKEDYVNVENNSLSENSYSSSGSTDSFCDRNSRSISNSRNELNDVNIYQNHDQKIRNNTCLIKSGVDTNNDSDDEYLQPYDSLYKTKNHVKGTNGLYNLGNTCFMNSGIQCIANTTLLREYLMKGLWKKELNLTSIHGMKGKMVKAFVEVLNNLWSENESAFRPYEFKAVIGQFTPLFEGYHQHDCQEFIASLLDGLHEDINRVKEKKFEEYPEMNKYSDEEAAKISWDLHIRRENSIIVDLFYGQYRSINICNQCNTKRLNFEPFVYLTLPIPETQELELPIVVLVNGKKLDTLKIVILKSESILNLKMKIINKLYMDHGENIKMKLTSDYIEIYQARDYYINSIYRDDDTIDNIHSLENNYYSLYAYINTYKYQIHGIDTFITTNYENLNNESGNTNNIPVYQSVENAERYQDEDNGTPFYINLPDFSLLENDMKEIDRELFGWIVYRELVKYYQNFTNIVIATNNPNVELDESVNELKMKIKKEEEELNAKINSRKNENNQEDNDLYDDSIKTWNRNSHSSSNNEDDDNRASINSNDIDKESNSEAMVTKQKDENDNKTKDSDNEDIELENAYKNNLNKLNINDNKNGNIDQNQDENENINDRKMSISEDETETEVLVEDIYEIKDGWKIINKLFDVKIIYSNRNNDNSFYSYMYNTSSASSVQLYKCKKSKTKSDDDDKYTYRSYNNSREDITTEKINIWNKKDLIIMVTWNPEILKFLFGKGKFDIFKIDKERNMIRKIETPPISLEECLQEFIKEETLTGENKWFCPECKDYREAYKKMDLWSAPEILIIHLKRFIQDRRYYSSRKNNVLVKFPLKGLDLTDIIIGPKSDERYIYNLYAISNHSGSTSGGHYTAYIKNQEKWYHFNDSFVSEESEENIMTSKAYLLFYERCHEPGKEFKLPNLDNLPDVVESEDETINKTKYLPFQELNVNENLIDMDKDTSDDENKLNNNNNIQSNSNEIDFSNNNSE